MKLLIFQLGDKPYAIETEPAHCIVIGGQESVSSIDTNMEAIEGLVEMEGRTSAVINLAAILPKNYTNDSNENDKKERLIVYDIDDELIVFRIEGVKESIEAKAEEVQPVEPSTTLFFKGVIKRNEQLIPLVDPTQILRSIH